MRQKTDKPKNPNKNMTKQKTVNLGENDATKSKKSYNKTHMAWIGTKVHLFKTNIEPWSNTNKKISKQAKPKQKTKNQSIHQNYENQLEFKHYM